MLLLSKMALLPLLRLPQEPPVLTMYARWIIFSQSYDVVLQPQSWLKLLFCLAACISAALHISDSFSMHAPDLRAILNHLQVRKAYKSPHPCSVIELFLLYAS